MSIASTPIQDSEKSDMKRSKSIDSFDSDKAEGKALADDILTNGHKYYMDSGPMLLPSWFNQELITEYLSTIMHMYSWYQSDLRNPNSKGRQSIAAVRSMHSAATRIAGPITQKDLALTQFGFIGFALTSAKQLALPKDQAGLIHFWRVIGHLLGIQDRFNLFRGNLQCSIAACEEISKRYFCPNFISPTEQFNDMSEALLKGMWPMIVFYNPSAFKEHTRRLCGCPPEKLNFIQNVFLYLQIFVFKLLQIQIISYILLPIMNFHIWFTIFVQNTMPVIAFLTFHSHLTLE